MQRLHGLMDLTFDLVEETTNLVERTHDAVVERSTKRLIPEALESTGKVVTNIHTRVSRGVFGSIRVINGIARVAAKAAAGVAKAELALSLPSATTGNASRYANYLQASLNGFWGDSLNRKGSCLDLGMTIRHHGQDVPVTREALSAAFPNSTKKVCVFVHGLAATEALWSLSSQEHYGAPDITYGTRLHGDLGFTPIYTRYNTGRHISENGRALARLLTEVLAAYPVAIEEITFVGHSMGGLVARSAAHYARQNCEPWISSLCHVASIGSPNLGAPLEKAVNVLTGVLRNVEAAGAQVPAELLDSRSDGVKDLRYGYTVDEEWVGTEPDDEFADNRRNVPFVEGVGYYFLAATISRDPQHPWSRLFGDLMVRLPSASGKALEPSRRIPFDKGRVFPGMTHLQIANHPDVYEALRDLLVA